MRFLLSLCSIIVFWSCSTTPDVVTPPLVQVETVELLDWPAGPEAKVGQWIPVSSGIERNFIINQELPIAVYAFRIDLEHPNRQVMVGSLTPSEGFHTLTKTTMSFAEEYQVQIAINATTFAPYQSEEGQGVNLTTLSIYEGEIQAPQRDPMAALMVMWDGSVKLHWPPFDYDNIRYAAGCGPLFLLEGKNRGRSDSRHPRSSVGLSQDGRYLILMVIDGRKDDYSIGASMAEAANWMRDLGAWNALNLDGGGSSTLVWLNPDTGELEEANEPSGPPARGVERPVANHIGIY